MYSGSRLGLGLVHIDRRYKKKKNVYSFNFLPGVLLFCVNIQQESIWHPSFLSCLFLCPSTRPRRQRRIRHVTMTHVRHFFAQMHIYVIQYFVTSQRARRKQKQNMNFSLTSDFSTGRTETGYCSLVTGAGISGQLGPLISSP